ncbi:MAG: 4-phosphoerythronate dehydrogenase PdxB [Bacteroidales bacterium]|jgi:erythronate-4-phosphate dehydrogenase
MKVVADDKIPFLKGALEPYAEVVYIPGKQINREILKDADALLIRTRTKCTENLLEETGVRFIGTATIGFDHIDTHYCSKNKITWTNAPGCNSTSVQQYIAAALLKISSEYHFNLKDKTLGIIGVGNVGSKVEKFARSIGMNVLLNDPPRARVEGKKKFHNLNAVLSESDIVTVHIPLNVVGEDYTYHLFNEASFRKFKKGAWFINTSRGEVTDTYALKKVLNSDRLGGAAIDVWENEPDIDLKLMQQAFIATPHIAGYSTDGKANGTSMVVNSLTRFFKLPSENWYPANIPIPPSTYISIDCNKKPEEEIIEEAVIHTYNIDEDNDRLRLSPADFEKLRGDYRLRREFTSYTVDLKDGTEKVRKILMELGFRILI